MFLIYYGKNMEIIYILFQRLEIRLEVDLFVVQAELASDVVSISINRTGSHPYDPCNLFCCFTVFYKRGYLGLPWGKIEL
jgi:hypothetical protein